MTEGGWAGGNWADQQHANRRRRLLMERAGILAILALSPYLLTFFAQPAPALGLEDGTLFRCTDRPNCVCSVHYLIKDPIHGVEPFMIAPGKAQEAWQTLERLVLNEPRTRLVEKNDRYMRFERRTPVYRFVDDLEFLLTPNWPLDTIAVRSASRLGFTDGGRNMAFVEHLREQYYAALNLTEAYRAAKKLSQWPAAD